MAQEPLPMVMTTLEATVDEGRWEDLRRAFAEAIAEPEPGLVETFLVQAQNDPTLWRIVTVWRDLATLQAMRTAGPPRGPRIFRAAGAEPSLVIAEVVGHRTPLG